MTLPIVVTVALAVAVLLIGSRLTTRREHNAWLRDKRLQAYSQLFDASWAAKDGYKLDKPARTQIDEQMLKATLFANFISPKWLRKRIWNLDTATGLILQDDSNELIRQAWANQHRELMETIQSRFGYDLEPRTISYVAAQLKSATKRRKTDGSGDEIKP